MKVGEVYVALKLDSAKFNQGIAGAKKQLATFALSMAATVYAVDRFIERSTNAATKLTNLGNASGITVSKLKQYGLAATLTNAGISAEEASAQVAKFSENLYNLQRFSTGNAEGFNRLAEMGLGSISFYGKKAEDVIEELREKIKGLSNQSAISLLGSFGFSPEMLPLMRMTRQEMENIASTRMMTEGDIKQLEEADRIINELKIDFLAFQNAIVVKLAPAIKTLSEEFRNLSNESGLSSLSLVLKSIATSIELISTGAASIKDAAAIAGSTFSSSGVSDEVNAEIRAKNKTRWQRTMEKLRGMWSESPQAQAPSGGGKAGLNNFGNIRGANGEFKSFATPEEGMKAMVADIRAKISGRSSAMAGKYGAGYVPTLEKLISTYAPPNENNTAGYIDYVSKQTGIGSDRPLTEADLRGIVGAMAKMEGNRNISVNTTNHINGGDAQGVAASFESIIQRNLDYAMSDANNGAR